MLTERLILLREEKRLTRKDIAEYLKIDQSTYGKYELGKREPDYDTLTELANFFDVTTDYLLGQSNIRNHQESRIETKAYHNLDTSGLPEEDIKKVEEYVELLKKKYNPDGTLKKSL
jgi:transcriptional regulator with XRE-family HTH domain